MGLQLETPRDLLDVYKAINIISYFMSSSAVIVNGGIALLYVIQRIRRPQSSKLTPAGCLVMNLLVADCLCGVVCIYVAQFKMWPENAREMATHRYTCPIRFAGGFLGFIGSHFALLAVVIDRYIAVLHTLRYREVMTTRQSVNFILIGWVIPVIGAVVIMTDNEWHEGIETCNENTIIPWFLSHVWVPVTVLVLFGIALIQAVVHYELRRRSRVQSAMSVILRRMTKKSARVLLQSTTTFVVCWGAFDSTILVYTFYPHKLTKLLYDISFLIALLSFISNPMLYSYRTESIRKPVSMLMLEMKNFFLCRKTDLTPPSSIGRVSNLCTVRQLCEAAIIAQNGAEKNGKNLSLSEHTYATSVDYNVV